MLTDAASVWLCGECGFVVWLCDVHDCVSRIDKQS